jgi:hypothetical protein
MLLPGVDHPISQKARRGDYRHNPRGKGQESGQPFRMGHGYNPHHGERGEHTHPRPQGRFRQRPGGHAEWPGSSRPGGGGPGGEVGSDRGQVRVGLRRERLAHPRVKLIFVQPILHERGLEQLDYLLAVGARRAEAAITPVSCGRYPIARPCYHGASPPACCSEA